MKIQVINVNETSQFRKKNIIIQSNFSSPRSIDEFDYNFIDLSSQNIWTGSATNKYSTYSNDFRSVQKMIESANHTQIIIILPKNIEFIFKDYGQPVLLKNNIIDILRKNIMNIVPDNYAFPSISFEITDTEIGEQVKFTSDFIFERGNYNLSSRYSEVNPFFVDELTVSKLSKKCTTMRVKKKGTEFINKVDRSDIIMTSLQLKTDDNFFDFLGSTELINNNKTEVPKWIEQVEFYNDKELEKKQMNKKIV